MKPQMNGVQHTSTGTSCDRRTTSEPRPDIIPRLAQCCQASPQSPIHQEHFLFAAEMILSIWKLRRRVDMGKAMGKAQGATVCPEGEGLVFLWQNTFNGGGAHQTLPRDIY